MWVAHKINRSSFSDQIIWIFRRQEEDTVSKWTPTNEFTYY